MKTVILALAGVLIGGGVGTTGGAFLLARCESEAAEAEAHDEDAPNPADEPDGADEGAAGVEPDVDTVGSMGPVPDLTDDAAPTEVEPADPEAGDAPADEAPADAADPVSEEADAADDAPPAGAVDPAAPAVDPIVLAPTPDPTALRRLARIFSNMKAEQAAAVMVKLSDAEAQRILVSMPERAAAAILGKMDASRAAVLSRRVLGGGTGGGDR